MATQPATKPIVPAKIGFFGGTGSGKTTTAALLAAGISKTFHNSAPVYVYDTEPGWQFMRRPFVTEGVELIQERQRSFTGMVQHLAIAEKRGACIFVTDSMTHIWNDLMQTFTNDHGRVEFQDFNLIKKHWNNWTVNFLNSKMHCFALGRLGYDYDTVEKEVRGKVRKEIVKGDSKFKAGGGESFGYEPHLLVEMELAREGSHNGRGGKLVHSANVLKDRTRILNGETFEFRDIKGYKAGDYRIVFETFLPHLQEMQYVEGLPSIVPGNSDNLLPPSDGSYYQAKQNREVALETIEATITLLWPGQDKETKAIKIKAVELIFGTRSWKEISEKLTIETLEAGVAILRDYEKRMATDKPSTEDGVLNLLELCKQTQKEKLEAQVF